MNYADLFPVASHVEGPMYPCINPTFLLHRNNVGEHLGAGRTSFLVTSDVLSSNVTIKPYVQHIMEPGKCKPLSLCLYDVNVFLIDSAL